MTLSKRQEELQKLAKRHKGVLTPDNVVAFAKNPKTALHDAFEWDDTVAGVEWRLEQARRIIRAHVTIVECNGHSVKTRAYVALDSDRGAESYRTIGSVMSSAEWREELLGQARRDMQSFRTKYSTLTELVDVFAVMTKAERAIA